MSHDIVVDNVVKAQNHHTDVVVKILAEAFADDPVTTWISPDTDLWLPSYFHILSSHYFLPRGKVYMTKDGSGASLWLPPRQKMRNLSPFKSLEILRGILSVSGKSAVLRSMIAAVYLDIYRIREPHYYLHVIGVRKQCAGKGTGTELMREALSVCDAEGIPAYLENSNIRNMDFYRKLGFRTLRKIRLLSHGPDLWLMMRRPSSVTI